MLSKKLINDPRGWYRFDVQYDYDKDDYMKICMMKKEIIFQNLILSFSKYLYLSINKFILFIMFF